MAQLILSVHSGVHDAGATVGLVERVAVYRSDNLDGIQAFERWDLVVENPPPFSDISPGELRFHDEG